MKKIAVGLILVGLAVVSMSSMFFHNRQTNKTYHAEEALQSIIIDDKNSPVTVVGTNDNRATIEYKESRNNKYRLKERDGVLTLERKDNWFFFTSWFSFGNDQGEVVVEVPKDQLENLDLETSNASVSVKNLSVNSADIETSNNEIKLSKLKVSDTIDAETSNGKITLSDLTFSDGEFITSNSKLEADRLDGKNILLETSNGNLKFDNVKVGSELTVDSSNASIQGYIIGKQSDFEINSDTSNGQNTPGNSEGSGEKVLDMNTSNGDITVKFSE
ncbi:DUF4097 family beta strand repeat-containing protein [Enterococcus sp. AZ163]|uniref:DUF4097 family beta strand repeat-containing protein n=1 Tax=Enterococcus sp. AZ163 TaxID=2774638 RepID=UPI003D276794